MKFQEIKKMTKSELEKKMRELKIELARASASKTGAKIRQIKKMIAKIKTINKTKQGGARK